MLVAAGAWLLHVAALARAPLSLVQAVISGGLVFLAVLAERVFGLMVAPRQWLGIGLTALGLVFLTATLPSTAGAEASYSVAAMVAFEAGLLSVGTLLLLSRGLGALSNSTPSCSARQPACCSGSRTSRSRRSPPPWPTRGPLVCSRPGSCPARSRR
jgi:drug/metabolite transporter (DMT)-like permease